MRARELGERIRAPHELVQVVDGDLLVGGDRDDLLREDVERVARDDGLLDAAFEHALDDDGRLEQVGAELREDAALGDRAEVVTGAPDTLQAAGDRLRRLHLDDEVDRTHVDAELERRGRDETRNLSRLQQLLDLDALLARERPVVCARDFFLRELVETQREPLSKAAVVDEDDRRAMRFDELEDLRVDRRPDRARGAFGSALRCRTRLAHVLHRHDDLEVELFRDPGVDELDVPCARDEAADLLHRPLRRRQADALERLVDEPLEPLHGKREVRAALRAGDRVNLVEDQRPDALQVLARARGEQQVERLGSRDQDVRWVPEHLGALLLGRVPGANADPELRLQPGERPAQVALDVVVQRLQRGDVDQAQALAGLRVELVDPVEEGGERLSRAGRRLDQRVLAAGDRGPAELLCRGRPGERLLEPGACFGAEKAERVHPVRVLAQRPSKNQDRLRGERRLLGQRLVFRIVQL